MSYRNRVCIIGNETDMQRILTNLLVNCGYYEPPEERPPYSLDELIGQIEQRTREDGDANDTFLYNMISRHRYGTAEEGTCRLQVTRQACGLYSALFRYDSTNSFQPHEWSALHKQCGYPLIVAQRASEDFMLDKGEVIFSAGQTLDNWNNMCECWVWLMGQYGCGLPPEEAVEHFRDLDQVLRREEYDVNAAELLRSCRQNLESVAYHVSDPDAMREAMQQCVNRQDFVHLSEYHYALAESVLWETEHNHKWFATIDAVLPLL